MAEDDHGQIHDADPIETANPSLLDTRDLSNFFNDAKAWMKELEDKNGSQGRATGVHPGAPATKSRDPPVLNSHVSNAEDQALQEIGSVNWIGKLYEYRMAHPIDGTTKEIVYSEASDYSIYTPRFTCTVNIPETTQQFGSTLGTISFSAKKPAKQHAAKKAVDWLIANSLMPSDGSVRFPKPQNPSMPPVKVYTAQSGLSPPPPEKPNYTSPCSRSYASQVPALCERLGFTVPRYVFDTQPGSPMCNAYADFGYNVHIGSRVGEVRDVYGKKNAKERVAEQVIEFLKGIEKKRLESFA